MADKPPSVLAETEPLFALVPVLHRLLSPRRTVHLLVSADVVRLPFELQHTILGAISIPVLVATGLSGEERAWALELPQLNTHFAMLGNAQRGMRSGVTTLTFVDEELRIISKGDTHTQIESRQMCRAVPEYENPLSGEFDLAATISLPRPDLVALLSRPHSLEVGVQRLIVEGAQPLVRASLTAGPSTLTVVKDENGADVSVPPELDVRTEDVVAPMTFPHHDIAHLTTAMACFSRMVLGFAPESGLLAVHACRCGPILFVPPHLTPPYSNGGELRALLSTQI